VPFLASSRLASPTWNGLPDRKEGIQ